MGRNDKILKKQDPKDLAEFNNLVSQAFQARYKIETGFIELAQSIFLINKKKLYRVKYKTFAQFCEEELGFSRQTIYVYISILKLINEYKKYFSKEKAVEFGHKKMRHITEGVNAIDKIIVDTHKREKKKIEIFKKVKPTMASTEIEALIEDIIDEL
ncbi:MAG: hypothetical protein OEZ22_04895 [Spirochaetia bacterium]|nr:hypothetical protein [Spirochaetia bacterium]